MIYIRAGCGTQFAWKWHLNGRRKRTEWESNGCMLSEQCGIQLTRERCHRDEVYKAMSVEHEWSIILYGNGNLPERPPEWLVVWTGEHMWPLGWCVSPQRILIWSMGRLRRWMAYKLVITLGRVNWIIQINHHSTTRSLRSALLLL